MITRRSLLRAGAGAAAIAAVGGGRARAMARQSIWGPLRDRLTGDLVLPADSGYSVAKQVNYAQYGDIDPAAIAFCETVQDVQACVRFASSHGLPGTPRSGGHSLGGYSLSRGLVIDVSRLKTVRPDGDTVSVGAGIQQVDLLNALSADGLALPQAPYPTVGTAGYIQGGGMGFECRQFGLASDLLLSADLVLADGSTIHCSETRNADLFWALRGGGGGNFGIATAFRLRPVPIPQMTVFTLPWTWDDSPELQKAWQEWTIGGSRTVATSLITLLQDAAPGTVPQVAVRGVVLGGVDEANKQIDALVSAVGKTPTARVVQELSRRDGLLQLFGCTDLTISQCHRQNTTSDGELPQFNFTVERNRLFDHALPAAGLDKVLSAYEAARRAGQIRILEFVALGGAINDVGRTETAYVHRDSEFFIRVGFGLPTASPDAADVAAGQQWANDLFGLVDGLSDGESYQNFIDPELTDWRASYYAENYPALRRIKHHYDPADFFRFAQSIGA